jgi:hypothetical protein
MHALMHRQVAFARGGKAATKHVANQLHWHCGLCVFKMNPPQTLEPKLEKSRPKVTQLEPHSAGLPVPLVLQLSMWKAVRWADSVPGPRPLCIGKHRRQGGEQARR